MSSNALSSRTARAALKAHKRHWRTISKGLALGYWRGRNRATWLLRQVHNGKYRLSVIGAADDRERADNVRVFDFAWAQKRALALAGLSAGPITVEQAIKQYVAGRVAAKGERAAEDARQRLQKHVSPALGPKRVGDLTLSELKTWRDRLVTRKDSPISRATANRIVANLKALLSQAFRDDMNGITSDRSWRVLETFKNASSSRKDHFEADQVQRLIDATRGFDSDFADLLTAGFVTGCRYGELAGCDVRHFDAKNGALLVPAGKTGARPVILTADATAFFKSITKGREPDVPLFKKADGTRWGKSEQHRPIKRALKLAKLPPSASFYTLRHSYISRSIEADVPLFIIAKNVGTGEKMIREHYAHLLAVKERKLLERAAKALKLRVIQGGRKTA